MNFHNFHRHANFSRISIKPPFPETSKKRRHIPGTPDTLNEIMKMSVYLEKIY